MEVTLNSTSKIVNLNGTPARIWEGESGSGIKCHAFIVRIAVDKAQDCAEFETDLQEHVPPSIGIDTTYPDNCILAFVDGTGTAQPNNSDNHNSQQ